MKKQSFWPAKLKALAAVPLLLSASMTSLGAQDAVPPADVSPAAATKAAPPIEELRAQLIASLRADILAKRDKREHSESVMTLAQTVELLTVEAAPGSLGIEEWLEMQSVPGGPTSAWQSAVQLHGSEKSMELGLQYARGRRVEALADASRRVAGFEAAAKKVAETIFSVRTAEELEPLVEQIPILPGGAVEGVPNGLCLDLNQLRGFLKIWQTYLAARDAGNSEQALRALREVRLEQRNVPWVSKSELIKQIDSARYAAGLPTPDAVTDAIHRLSEKALSVEKGVEIDPLLFEAQKMYRVLQIEELHPDSSRLHELVSFLRLLQKALILCETSNASGFKEAVRELERYHEVASGISSSKLLVRLNALNETLKARSAGDRAATDPPQAILDRVQRLEDLASGIATLDAAIEPLPKDSPERFNWLTVRQEMRSIAQQYHELLNGFPGRVSPRLTMTGEANPKMLALQRQLILMWLHRLVGEEIKVVPEVDDNPVSYLRRMLVTARDRKNWRLVQRIIELAQGSIVQDPSIKATDSSAIASFITGSTQERASQFAFATASYLGALKNGSEWVPVEEIGDRLRVIEKDQAEAYVQGVEWARASSTSDRQFFPSYRPSSNPFGVQHPMAEQVLSGREKAPLLDIKVAEEEKKSVPETPSVGGEAEK